MSNCGILSPERGIPPHHMAHRALQKDFKFQELRGLGKAILMNSWWLWSLHWICIRLNQLKLHLRSLAWELPGYEESVSYGSWLLLHCPRASGWLYIHACKGSTGWINGLWKWGKKLRGATYCRNITSWPKQLQSSSAQLCLLYKQIMIGPMDCWHSLLEEGGWKGHMSV